MKKLIIIILLILLTPVFSLGNDTRYNYYTCGLHLNSAGQPVGDCVSMGTDLPMGWSYPGGKACFTWNNTRYCRVPYCYKTDSNFADLDNVFTGDQWSIHQQYAPPLGCSCIVTLRCPGYMRVECTNGQVYHYGDPDSCVNGPEPDGTPFDPQNYLDSYADEGYYMIPYEPQNTPFDADDDGLTDFLDPYPDDPGEFTYSYYTIGYDDDGTVVYAGILTEQGDMFTYGNYNDVAYSELIITLDEYDSTQLNNQLGEYGDDFTGLNQIYGTSGGGGGGGGGGSTGGGTGSGDSTGGVGSSPGGGGGGSTSVSGITAPNLNDGALGSDTSTVNENLVDIMVNQQEQADIAVMGVNKLDQIQSDSEQSLDNQVVGLEKLQNLTENLDIVADNTNQSVNVLLGIEAEVIELRDHNNLGFNLVANKLGRIEDAIGDSDLGGGGSSDALDAIRQQLEQTGDYSFDETDIDVDAALQGVHDNFDSQPDLTDYQEMLLDEPDLYQTITDIITTNPVTDALTGITVNSSGDCYVTCSLFGSSIELSLCDYAGALNTWGQVILMIASFHAVLIVFRRS